jgi:endoglucanase
VHIPVAPVPVAPVAAAPAGDPFGNIRFFVDPSAAASSAIRALAADATALAAVRKVATGPQADWFGDWNSTSSVRGAVAARAGQIRAAGALPVFVAYDIPQRDCGGYSGGGASSPDAYRAWIRQFAAGIGHGPAAVILEPDALAGLDCLSAGAQQTRYGLLSDAVNVLSGTGVSVYLDAGSSSWKSASTMAQRLRSAGVARARGFSLNVSNFNYTSKETAFGDAIVAALGGSAHFIVDTSRNGLGPTADHQWCNPPGRALGKSATAATGDPRADAFYWIKTPGESDGTCNGGPAAGGWWTNYAIGLGQRAVA